MIPHGHRYVGIERTLSISPHGAEALGLDSRFAWMRTAW